MEPETRRSRLAPLGLEAEIPRLPLLSVLIVNYNVKDFLEQTLVSVRNALGQMDSEIIVVDNASSDASVGLVRSRFPNVTLIENSENVGFAKACNQALGAASGAYLVLLNPDTIVQDDTFKRMIDFFEESPDTGLLGCKILNPDGSLQLACRRSFPTPWVAFTKLSGLSWLFPRSRLFGKYNLTYLDHNKPSEVDAVSGSLMMIQRKVLEDVGYLDESFFLYGEDLDWCFRIRDKGWKVRYFPGTQIIHFKGESSKNADFDRLKVFYQAMSLFARKHFKNKYIFMPYRFLWVAIWIRAGFSFLIQLLAQAAVPLVDLTLLTLSLILSVYLRFDNFDKLGSFIPIIFVNSVASMFFLAWFGCYSKFKYSLAKSGAGVLAGFFVVAGLLFFFKEFAYSRFVVLIGALIGLLALPGWRLLTKLASLIGVTQFKGTVGKTLLSRNTLIVGDLDSGSQLIKKFKSRVDNGYKIAGLVSMNGTQTGETRDGIEVFGTLDDLNVIVKRNRIQEVIFTTHELSYNRILDLVTSLDGQPVNFKLAPANLDVVIGKSAIDKIDALPLLNLEYKLLRKRHRFTKRAFDFVLALLIVILTSPVSVVKARAGRRRPREVQVLGHRRRLVTIKEFESSFRVIRRLPTVISILKGDLSFVGSEIVDASRASEFSISDFELKPGLTGLTQINRDRDLSSDDKQRYHLYYVRNYSVLLDLEIIFKSLFKI